MSHARLAFLLLPLLAAACGNDSSSGPPTQPGGGSNPPPAQTNRAPTITAMSVTGFGIQSLSQFAYSGSATDPDGDSITYAWEIGGTPFSGSSGAFTSSGGGTFTARLTVSDGKGGTASDTRNFVVGSMTGNWRGTNAGLGPFTMSLTQTVGFITGTYADTSNFGPGRTDPAQPGIIRADGTFEMRMKQGIFTDFTFRGQMDQTGNRLTGGIFGSGFTGQPFVMDRQ